MAKRGNRGARGRSAGRSVKSSSQGRRAPRDVAEVEIVEESGGAGWEGGVAIATFIALLLAILLVDKHMGANFDKGFLF